MPPVSWPFLNFGELVWACVGTKFSLIFAFDAAAAMESGVVGCICAALNRLISSFRFFWGCSGAERCSCGDGGGGDCGGGVVVGADMNGVVSFFRE